MIKYNSVVNPKNTDRIIYTGTIEELKLLLSKFSLRDGSKWVKVDPLSPPGVSESKFANRRGIFMIFFKKSSLNWGVSEFCIQINDDSFYSYRHFGLIKNNNRI